MSAAIPGAVVATPRGVWQCVETFDEIESRLRFAQDEPRGWIEFTAQTYEDHTFTVRVRADEVGAYWRVDPERYAHEIREYMSQRAARAADEEMRSEMARMAGKLADIERGQG